MGFFFQKPNNKFDSQLIMAESLFSNFVAEHNFPFVVADLFTQLHSKLFPDSKIASKFACKRTKCTQIIKRAIAPSLEDKVVQMCQIQPFSILCDESNDSNSNLINYNESNRTHLCSRTTGWIGIILGRNVPDKVLINCCYFLFRSVIQYGCQGP